MAGKVILILNALALAGLLMFGCATTPPPPSPGPIGGAGGATCETACAHLADLGCPAAKPTPRGETCAAVCANIEDSGILTYGVACVTTASSCAAADACGGPTK